MHEYDPAVRPWHRGLLHHPHRALYPRMIRSTRAILHPRSNIRLVAAGRGLRHLSEKHYLRRGLSIGQRVRLALDHHAAEQRLPVGAELWRRDEIRIVLDRSNHVVQEGDLTVALIVGDNPLHKMTVALVGQGVPFIGRSQGCANYHPEAREEFDAAFPQNSAARCTFAAVSGLARALRADHVIGVRAREQVCVPMDHYDEWLRFHRDYDELWESLGGKDSGFGFIIPLLDHDKPVEASSASHRRRARKRRAHWAEIERETIDVIG